MSAFRNLLRPVRSQGLLVTVKDVGNRLGQTPIEEPMIKRHLVVEVVDHVPAIVVADDMGHGAPP